MVKFYMPFFPAILVIAIAFGFTGPAWAQNGPTLLLGPESGTTASTKSVYGKTITTAPAFESKGATDTLYVGLNKVELLGLKKSAGTIIISDPGVLDVRLESSKRVMLLGLKVGETGFVIMDNRGRPMITATVVVGPASEHNVSITRDCTGAEKGCSVEEEYSCSPRCIRVANPAEIESTNANNGGGGAPIGGAGGAAGSGTTTAPDPAGTTPPAATAQP